MEIFRKEAMKRVSSPEQLDRLMTVINPVGWVALVITGVVLIAIVTWGFVGRLPVITRGPGILMQPGRVKGIFSLASGQVVEVNVYRGQAVTAGMVVARVQLAQNFPDTARVDIVAGESGRVSDVLVRPGTVVTVGQRLFNLTGDSKDLVAALFMPLDQGKKVHPGMEVRISPSTVKEDDYGFLLGRVTRTSQDALSEAEMTEILGNQDLVKMMVGEGGVYQTAPIYVLVELERDLSTPSTYRWTSKKGPDYGISAGTACMASVVTEEQMPADMVIPYLKKLLGAKSWQEQ